MDIHKDCNPRLKTYTRCQWNANYITKAWTITIMFDLNSGLLDTLTSLSFLPYINKMLNLKDINQYMEENICILTHKEMIFFLNAFMVYVTPCSICSNSVSLKRNSHLLLCSVAKTCLVLWDLMNCSMPGLPVLHCLPEFAQTHAHWVGDAIQPSHSLSSPPPPVLNLFYH